MIIYWKSRSPLRTMAPAAKTNWLYALWKIASVVVAMKALSRDFILGNLDSSLHPNIIPKQCLMELVTPNEASTINEAFERAKKLKNNEGCRHKQRKASVDKFFKPPQKKPGPAGKKKAPRWKATKKTGRARGGCVAFSQYTQLDIIGGG